MTIGYDVPSLQMVQWGYLGGLTFASAALAGPRVRVDELEVFGPESKDNVEGYCRVRLSLKARHVGSDGWQRFPVAVGEGPPGDARRRALLGPHRPSLFGCAHVGILRRTAAGGSAPRGSTSSSAALGALADCNNP